MWPSTLVALCLILWAETLPAAASQIQSSDCLACHNDASLVTSVQGKPVSLYIPEKTFAQSVHSVLNCTDCHTDIKSIPHQPGLTKPSCGYVPQRRAVGICPKRARQGGTPRGEPRGPVRRLSRRPTLDSARHGSRLQGLSQQHSQHLRELSPAKVCHERDRSQHPSVLCL